MLRNVKFFNQFTYFGMCQPRFSLILMISIFWEYVFYPPAAFCASTEVVSIVPVEFRVTVFLQGLKTHSGHP